MAKAKKTTSQTNKPRTLEQAVKQAVPQTWSVVSADVDWEIDLDGAVELCLDADRPVSFGFMTETEYEQLLKTDNKIVDGWAREALRGYF